VSRWILKRHATSAWSPPPDDIDWDDEVRIAIEERASLSPDALTGMEASLRFAAGDHAAARVRRLPHGRTGSSTGRTRSASRSAQVYGTARSEVQRERV
jgi:hypothetical protein